MQFMSKTHDWLSPANSLLFFFLSLSLSFFSPYNELQMAMWLRLVVFAVLLKTKQTKIKKKIFLLHLQQKA